MSSSSEDVKNPFNPYGPSYSSQYPEPYIVEPISEHKQSWIVLHGRGDRAKSFASGILGFLNLPFPDGRTIAQHLPNVRFIFPTASHRRAGRFNRAVLTQWFDLWSWDNREHEDWQVEGLRETSAWVHELVRREVEVVGAENVVLGGLSQGGASALVSMLLRSGETLKAVFSMSGWLPFRHTLDSAVQEDVKVEEEVFERKTRVDGHVGKDIYGEAVAVLCQELGLPVSAETARRRIPILIAHGAVDEKVDVQLGRGAAECLKKLGCDVTYCEYPSLVHWMSGQELADIVNFVKAAGVTEETQSSVEREAAQKAEVSSVVH